MRKPLYNRSIFSRGNSPDPRLNVLRRRLARIAAWVWGGTMILTLLLFIAVTVALHSTRVHNAILRSVESQAGDSLGVRVQLQNFAPHFSTLSLDLYGVAVDGASPYPNPPFLQVQHAEVGVRIVSILHRKWYLDSFRVDNPVVQVFVDSHGVSNIPAFNSTSGSKSNTSIFDLGIRHAVVDHGEVFYNSRPSSLAVDLHNVEFRAAFNSLQQKYSGELAYSNGNLAYGTFRPLPHDLDVKFDATPATLNITQARVVSGATQFNLSATLNNYSNPAVDGRYDITVDGKQMAQLLGIPSVAGGQVRATGSVQYRSVADRPLLEGLVVNGDLASQRLDMKTATMRGAVEKLAAHYSLAKSDLDLRDLHANVLGGELFAHGTMADIAGNSHSNVTASLRGVSLAQARQLLGPSASTANVTLSGALNAQASATWEQSFDDLIAHVDGMMTGQVTQRASSNASAIGQNAQGHAGSAPSAIPLDSVIHATYHGANQELAVDNSFLHTEQTSVTMNGVVSKRSSLNVRLQADDLREVSAIADLFRTPDQGHPVQPIDLAGTASFQGTVQGSTTSPHLTGQLTASNVRFNGTSWKTLRTDVDLSPGMASLQHADLEPASRGHITFDGSAGLTKWAFSKTSPVRIQLDASQLNIADLTRLAGQQIPVTGMMSANVSLRGTELNPLGSGKVSLINVTAYGQPVKTATVDVSGSGEEAHAKVVLVLTAGSVQGNVSIKPNQRTFDAQLTSSGIRLDKLELLQAKNIDATGVVAINARGQGSFDNPQANASIQIPTLVIQHQSISGVNLVMTVTNHVANANLQTSAAGTSIQAKATANLSGDYIADASLDTKEIPLQPLLATYAPEQAAQVTGQTEVHATLHGPLKNKNLLEAHVTIPVLKVAYSNTIQLAAASPLHADYKNGTIEIARGAIKGTDTNFEFQGSIPTTGSAAMSLSLAGTVNLQIAQLFDPDIRSSGQLKLNIKSSGALNAPNTSGQIEIVDANFASGDLPAGLQHANGVLDVTGNRMNIRKFEGAMGGGTLTARGGIAYRPAVQFDLGLAAQGIRILYPEGMREGVDANLRLSGSAENAFLSGAVNLSDLSFTPAFDLSSFVGQLSGGVAAPPSQGFSQNIQLNLAVHSTNNVNLVSRTLSVGGSANLQVRGTAANPVILGRVNLDSGDVILNGNRFILNGGTVQFVNPSQTEPVLNLTLSTSIQQYNINLRFNGPADQLRTEYSSNPALPAADIINLLAFGQTTEVSGANPTPNNQMAESLVASQVSSQVTSRISKIAGISQLSISPVLAGSNSQGPAGANITIQQRVTGNLFVTFSSNVASTQSQTIQGQYQVSPRVAVSATRDPNGGFAVDILTKKSW